MNHDPKKKMTMVQVVGQVKRQVGTEEFRSEGVGTGHSSGKAKVPSKSTGLEYFFLENSLVLIPRFCVGLEYLVLQNLGTLSFFVVKKSGRHAVKHRQ